MNLLSYKKVQINLTLTTHVLICNQLLTISNFVQLDNFSELFNVRLSPQTQCLQTAVTGYIIR